jgi:hypothetical protein
MTKIVQKSNEVYVNNRLADYGSIEHIHQERAGAWMGYTAPRCGERYGFELTGGRASGGAANEWYLTFPMAFGDQPVRFNSAKAAIEAISKV